MKYDILQKISGPPGTGKSTYLLNEIDTLLSSRVAPDNIVFTTLTRAGAYEARDRACQRFGLPAQAFPYFRTIHSLCYQLMPKASLMKNEDWCEVGRQIGRFITVNRNQANGDVVMTPDMMSMGGTRGDYLLGLWSLSRALRIPLKETYLRRSKAEKYSTVQFEELQHFVSSVENYKQENGKIDFTDCLERYLANGESLPVDYVFVDEAQDLSPLQWGVIDRMSIPAKKIWVAGDDDQCIYEWNGADPVSFISLPGNHHVLPQSYRIPASVHSLANIVIHRVRNRIPKEYKPRNEEGSVTRTTGIRQVDLSAPGTWFLLGRTGLELKQFVTACRLQGVLYTGSFSCVRKITLEGVDLWRKIQAGESIDHAQAIRLYSLMSCRDRVAWGAKKKLEETNKELSFNYALLAEYYGLVIPQTLPWPEALDMIPMEEMAYLTEVENKGGIGQVPRIHISTLHGVKGMEADNVVLATDLSHMSYQSFLDNPDAEHRLWYVGITRARKTLTILRPNTDKFYPL